MPAPSTFTDDLAADICDRIANGESLRAICRDDGYPEVATVCRWLLDERYAAFREQYTRARDIQADVLADEVIDIANTPQKGIKKTTKPDGSVETVEMDMIDHRRLKIDARKWFAGQVAPKKYGSKVVNEHSGPDGGAIKTEATVIVLPANGREVAG